MAEWFAVPCRALAGIAIIARDNAPERRQPAGVTCDRCHRQVSQHQARSARNGANQLKTQVILPAAGTRTVAWSVSPAAAVTPTHLTHPPPRS